MIRYVVSYDIADDRRRRRIASILEGFGDRVQESVFELYVKKSRMEECKNHLLEVIDNANDGLAIYSLCETCNSRREYFGISTDFSNIGEETVFIA